MKFCKLYRRSNFDASYRPLPSSSASDRRAPISGRAGRSSTVTVSRSASSSSPLGRRGKMMARLAVGDRRARAASADNRFTARSAKLDDFEEEDDEFPTSRRHSAEPNLLGGRSRRMSTSAHLGAAASSLSGVEVYTTSTRRLTLTTKQCRALQTTWKSIGSPYKPGRKLTDIFEDVFEKALKKEQTLKDIFQKGMVLTVGGGFVTKRSHARLLMGLIEQRIAELNGSSRERVDVTTIGKNHQCLKANGFKAKFWDDFFGILMDSLIMQESIRESAGAGKAWTLLIANLNDEIRAGFGESKPKLPMHERRKSYF